MVDWKGIVRELRLLVTELQRDRFYALYVLPSLLFVGRFRCLSTLSRNERSFFVLSPRLR